ncbi:MAG: hypothetical protein Q8N42_02025 [bacterium]|nr:hypothetical protein [bacterium]
MTIDIDQAIKNLKAAKKDAGMVPDDEWTPTLNLAIKALKHEKLIASTIFERIEKVSDVIDWADDIGKMRELKESDWQTIKQDFGFKPTLQ